MIEYEKKDKKYSELIKKKKKRKKTLNVMITVPQKSHNQLFFLWI